MIDILDRLQEQKGHVRLVMTSGEIVFGKPDGIVYVKDKGSDKAIKTIRFLRWDEAQAKHYKNKDIKEYDPIDEEEIPPYE